MNLHDINSILEYAVDGPATPLPLALTPTAWLQAIPAVLAQLEPHERVTFIVDALQMFDRAGVEVAGCAVDCIETMIYWK